MSSVAGATLAFVYVVHVGEGRLIAVIHVALPVAWTLTVKPNSSTVKLQMAESLTAWPKIVVEKEKDRSLQKIWMMQLQHPPFLR